MVRGWRRQGPPARWVARLRGLAVVVGAVALAVGLTPPMAVADGPPPVLMIPAKNCQCLVLSYSADPVSGTVVHPGDTITYTLTVSNLTGQFLEGELELAQVDLSQVLPFADLGSLPTGLTLSGTTLTWTLPELNSEAAVSFAVTVHAGAFDQRLRSAATSMNSACEDDCTTEHPTPSGCQGQLATIVGTPADDTLLGTDGPDVIAGLGGRDVIRGAGGDDLICSGDGNDTAGGGPGRDVVDGGGGPDSLFGGRNQDVLIGGDGNDTLRGLRGDDSLLGGSGLDRNIGGRGSDLCRSPRAGGHAVSCEH